MGSFAQNERALLLRMKGLFCSGRKGSFAQDARALLRIDLSRSTMQRVAVCHVLQCVMCCSALQSDATCCSVLQCVAV